VREREHEALIRNLHCPRGLRIVRERDHCTPSK
jgi:hypothetical protein